MPLVAPEHYEAVRFAIDTSLTASDLPAAVIAQPIYLGAADAEVKRRDPLWASRTGDAAQQLVQAAILLTAAYLAPAIPQLSAERYPEGYSYERATDYAQRAQELRQRAETLIQGVLAPGDLAASRPTLFAAACGRRGR